VGRLEDWKMNEFTEFVGFSIVGCETQCKALFQRIERGRHPWGGSRSSRNKVKSSVKGLRELRGL
jgi:hypothetical protein